MSFWSCRTYWGSHGCELPRGHDGPHVCDCCECDDHLRDHRERGCVAKPPYYGEATHFWGEDAARERAPMRRAASTSSAVTMGSKAHGAVIGWTTDAAKADACRSAGMSALPGYNATGPSGWEIIARPDPPPDEGEDVEAAKGSEG